MNELFSFSGIYLLIVGTINRDMIIRTPLTNSARAWCRNRLTTLVISFPSATQLGLIVFYMLYDTSLFILKLFLVGVISKEVRWKEGSK